MLPVECEIGFQEEPEIIYAGEGPDRKDNQVECGDKNTELAEPGPAEKQAVANDQLQRRDNHHQGECGLLPGLDLDRREPAVNAEQDEAENHTDNREDYAYDTSMNIHRAGINQLQ